MMWKLDKGFIAGIVTSTILTKTQNNYFIAGVDLMKFRGKDYLVTIDYYSNFWEIDYKKTRYLLPLRRSCDHISRGMEYRILSSATIFKHLACQKSEDL